MLLAGSGAAPRVLARERIELCEVAVQGSKQPYHAIAGLPLAAAQERLAQLEASALALAVEGLRTLRSRARSAGAQLRAAGILGSSARSCTTLEATLASHALIHAADGDHFRAALAAACGRERLRVTRLPRQELASRAAAVLGQTPRQLRAGLDSLGRNLGPPWGADQKEAALLAWLLLAAT